MADKIVVLNAGRIEQVGSPLELYHRPANLFVARFIGSPKMNVIPVQVAGQSGATLRLALPGGGVLDLPAPGVAPAIGSKVQLGIRPEHMSLEGGAGLLPGRVVLTEHLGSETIVHLEVPEAGTLVVRADGLVKTKVGDAITAGLPPAACHLFDAEGRALHNGSLL